MILHIFVLIPQLDLPKGGSYYIGVVPVREPDSLILPHDQRNTPTKIN